MHFISLQKAREINLPLILWRRLSMPNNIDITRDAKEQNVKLSLCMPWGHIAGVQAQLHSLDWGEWTALRPGRFCPYKRAPVCPKCARMPIWEFSRREKSLATCWESKWRGDRTDEEPIRQKRRTNRRNNRGRQHKVDVSCMYCSIFIEISRRKCRPCTSTY